MRFIPAVKSAFKRWNDFDGRSSRSEYWWLMLFGALFNIFISMVGGISEDLGFYLGLIIGLIMLVPGVALVIRRMHDIDKKGWWCLVSFIPLIGWAIFLYFAVQKGTMGSNRFGPDPLANTDFKENVISS